MKQDHILKGKLIDVNNRNIFYAELHIENGKIKKITEIDEDPDAYFILPGFIDAHIHIESSMLIPSEFARLAVTHGTVATVSDPHEIGNVLGVEGVKYMIANGKKVPFKFHFGAPSCVPATDFETAGAEISVQDIKELLAMEEIGYLAEMMNWPGVLHNDPVVLEKIALAKESGKPVDGHAPGLKGEMALKYAEKGISTDHECFSSEEALDKLNAGMKIIIREGSAAKNFNALIGLLDEHYDKMMFCSDDKHPDELMEGHINQLVKRAINEGNDLFKVLRVACVNPVEHYGLNVGLLRMGDPADFIVVENLENFKILQTYIDGKLVSENGKTNIPSVKEKVINNFKTSTKQPTDFQIASKGENLNVIEVVDNELITNKAVFPAKSENGFLFPDIENDILKLAVINRYQDTAPAIAFITNFGLKKGAIASSVGHDSHNITAVGTNDEAMAIVVNELIKVKGGVAAFDGEKSYVLPLPVAGLMSEEEGYSIGRKYIEIDKIVKEMGSKLNAPFMSLSFMALLVIPSIKLSDKGLFDGENFKFMEVSY
ncbi:adenine deaminase [Flexithrix dorotheae]|uniref:adenine deaminase n=1 Tax=Flexithrix dorotheae TaxID=70993 RepID=UPI000365D8B5|nr:adenine deaminase [Flexithrix dorotheae]